MLKKIMLPALLVMGMNASADEDVTKGLIGVEVGYIGTEYNAPGTGGTETDSVGAPSIGLKLGAEGEFYRAFVDSRYWYTDQYHSAVTVGAALQYLIRPVKVFNIFLGINGGIINTLSNGSGDTASNPYYGVDAGVNFDIADNFGIEVGARYANVNNSDKDYIATQFYQGYVSAIFKFTGAY